MVSREACSWYRVRACAAASVGVVTFWGDDDGVHANIRKVHEHSGSSTAAPDFRAIYDVIISMTSVSFFE